MERLRQRQLAAEILLLEHRCKLAGKLLQHPLEIGVAALQLQMGEVEAGDVEKVVDEILQPLGFFQGNAGVARPKFRREIRLVGKERQIAQDAGEGRFEVVCQIDYQIVFSLLCLLGMLGVPQRLGADQVELGFRLAHGRGQGNGLLRGMRQLFGCAQHGLQLPVGTRQIEVADDHPAHQYDRCHHQGDIVPDPDEQIVDGRRRPVQRREKPQARKGENDHRRDPGGQRQQIAAPGSENRAARSILIQWYTPPPRRS